jgi:hypothetical protein
MKDQKRVVGKGVYARMQSAVMGGYGRDSVNNAARIGAFMLSVVVHLRGRRAARLTAVKY